MLTERVKIVQILLAKICREVDVGYSKSIDKVRNELLIKGDHEITQFIQSDIENTKRYIDNKIESEEQKTASIEEEKKDPQKEQENLEKTVVIKFANFSTLVKQQSLGLNDANSLFNHHLMAIIGGFLNMGNDDESEAAILKKKANAASELIDKSEDAMFSKKNNSSAGINSWQS